MSSFPKVTSARLTGEVGVNYVSSVVNNDFRWIFRRNALEHDYGIDGYIDHVSDSLEVTGLSLAVQIKTDAGFFSTLKDGHYAFDGDSKHLNYYLNSPVPVVIVVVHPETQEARWVLFDARATVRRGSNYKLYIPEANRFDESARPQIRSIFGDPEDFSDAVAHHWAIQDGLSDADYLMLTLDREDIEAMDFTKFLDFFARITANPATAKKFIGRVNFVVAGYDEDVREMFEVPEFCKWLKALDKIWYYWFFFGATVGSYSILKLYLVVMCDGRLVSRSPDGQVGITFEREKVEPFLNRGFMGQNEMADKFSVSDERNREITSSVMATLFPDVPLS